MPILVRHSVNDFQSADAMRYFGTFYRPSSAANL
jgi:hypothetical protein